MKCEKCGKETLLDFTECPVCGQETQSHNKTVSSQSTTAHNQEIKIETVAKYNVARGLASFLSFIGWVDAIMGNIIAFFYFISLNGKEDGVQGGDIWYIVLIALGNTLLGLLIVALGQLLHVFIDTEKNTRTSASVLSKILSLLEEKKETSIQ